MQYAYVIPDKLVTLITIRLTPLEKLTQVRVYVTDIADWPAFNALYAKWAGASRPARCVVPVPQLHYGFKIEVEAVGLATPRP